MHIAPRKVNAIGTQVEADSIVVYPIVLGLIKDALVEIDKKNLTYTTLLLLKAKANLLQRDCYLVFR